MLAPAPPDAAAQVIDARDLAAWIVRAAEDAAPRARSTPSTARRRASDMFETCRRVAGSDAELVWVDGDFLAEHEVGEWMELPLWLHSTRVRRDARPSTRRRRSRAGLETRPLEETVRATLDWARSGEAPAEPPAGLARDKEQQVLDAWLSKE